MLNRSILMLQLVFCLSLTIGSAVTSKTTVNCSQSNECILVLADFEFCCNGTLTNLSLYKVKPSINKILILQSNNNTQQTHYTVVDGINLTAQQLQSTSDILSILNFKLNTFVHSGNKIAFVFPEQQSKKSCQCTTKELAGMVPDINILTTKVSVTLNSIPMRPEEALSYHGPAPFTVKFACKSEEVATGPGPGFSKLEFPATIIVTTVILPVLVLIVLSVLGILYWRHRKNKKQVVNLSDQLERPSPQGNTSLCEDEYSVPMDCIAPPPPVSSRPVRDKKQHGNTRHADCYQCRNNHSTVGKSQEMVYSKYPPTALQPPVVSNAYSTQPVLDSANSSSTPQPVKSHTEDQDGDVSKEEERKEALYFTPEKGGSETSSDKENDPNGKTANFCPLPQEIEDNGDQPDIN